MRSINIPCLFSWFQPFFKSTPLGRPWVWRAVQTGGLGLALGSTLAVAAPSERQEASLEAGLDQLYQTVLDRHSQNPWFKNENEADLFKLPYLLKRRQVPEFDLMSRADFGKAMKAYCVLMQSKRSPWVKNHERFGLIDYSKTSDHRRFYIYDIPGQRFVHQTWTTHGGNNTLSIWLNVKAANPEQYQQYVRDVVLSHPAQDFASLFSNRPGSDQSSVGMAVADPSLYFSTNNSWYGLRLMGLDGALNNKMRSRGVVFHEWNFDAAQIRTDQKAPSSQGCPMLPFQGYYQGQNDVRIGRLLMREIAGAPILFIHERMDPSVNQEYYEFQTQQIAEFKTEIRDRVQAYSDQYQWPNSVTAEIQAALTRQLHEKLATKVEESFQYFKNSSRFYGREPTNMAACKRILGI